MRDYHNFEPYLIGGMGLTSGVLLGIGSIKKISNPKINLTKDRLTVLAGSLVLTAAVIRLWFYLENVHPTENLKDKKIYLIPDHYIFKYNILPNLLCGVMGLVGRELFHLTLCRNCAN